MHYSKFELVPPVIMNTIKDAINKHFITLFFFFKHDVKRGGEIRKERKRNIKTVSVMVFFPVSFESFLSFQPPAREAMVKDLGNII